MIWQKISVFIIMQDCFEYLCGANYAKSPDFFVESRLVLQLFLTNIAVPLQTSNLFQRCGDLFAVTFRSGEDYEIVASSQFITTFPKMNQCILNMLFQWLVRYFVEIFNQNDRTGQSSNLHTICISLM